MDCTLQARSFLNLPAEIRIAIFELVFKNDPASDGFTNHFGPGGISIDYDYSAADKLQTLLVCKQFYRDASAIAIARTPFVMTNMFWEVANKLTTILHPKQISSIRSIAFVADARQFHQLPNWGNRPFGLPDLRLHSLTVVLHRSARWHYMFDFTADIVRLLRRLANVQQLVFVRNGALVKGNFRTWYNRLVGLIMKEDHRLRYDCAPAQLERTWWQWGYDDVAQSFCLAAQPARPMIDEQAYLETMKPLIHDLTLSMQNEEWNPDPRSRNGF